MGSQALDSGYIRKESLIALLNRVYGERGYDLKVSALEFSGSCEWLQLRSNSLIWTDGWSHRTVAISVDSLGYVDLSQYCCDEWHTENKQEEIRSCEISQSYGRRSQLTI
jgi:hypothetical protein